MIFTLIDYIKYKKRIGPYDLKKDKIMRFGFPKKISNETEKALMPGDMIFTFQYNSIISWAIMYLTKARMSHVAMCIGDKFILHSTTSGVVSEPINSLYGENFVLLPLHLNKLTELDRNKMKKFAQQKLGYPFGWDAFFIKFIRIITGRDIPYYRIEYLIDILILLIILDLPLYFLFNTIFFIFLIIPYLLLLIVNRILWKRRPIPVDKYYAKPIDIYKMLIIEGAQTYGNPYAVGNKEFWEMIFNFKNEGKKS